MSIEYRVFDPAVGFDDDPGPTKNDLLLRVEAAHFAAVNATPPNPKLIARLENRHGRVLSAPNPRAARRGVNLAIIAEEKADREGGS